MRHPSIPLLSLSRLALRSAISRRISSLGSAPLEELSEAANEMGQVWEREESVLELRDARYEGRLGLVQKALFICEGRVR